MVGNDPGPPGHFRNYHSYHYCLAAAAGHGGKIREINILQIKIREIKIVFPKSK